MLIESKNDEWGTMIDHVDAYTLSVRDLEKCVGFYHDKLGFTLEFKEGDFAYLTFSGQGMRGLALTSAESGGKVTSEAHIPPKEAPTRRNHFVVFVDDVDKEFEELKAKGVHFVSPPTTGRFGQRIGNFEDPEGNLWEISNHVG